MKKAFLAGLAVAFASMTLAFGLRDIARDVDSLHQGLEKSNRDVLQVRDELARSKDETLYRIEARAARAEAEERARSEPRDVRSLYRDVLAPSVQVSAKSGVGGGTLLFSDRDHSYVITAYHVVQAPPAKDGEAAAEAPEVRLYDVRAELADEVEADLVAHDEKKDLALLRLRTSRTYATVARLASRATLRGVRVFTPLYAIGCPLGHDPLPTLGEVAALRKEVGGENFWMMTAPTIFGNSGGGVFHRETHEMIGVSVMICTYDGVVSTPVPHLGILVSMETVYDWLDSLDYQFVYDPSRTIESCGHARAERLPASAGDR